MTDLREELKLLEMSQYLEVFVAEGFDSWERILDIRESDLNALKVKLGHQRLTTLTLTFQRRLQRAIAEWRGRAHNYHPPIALSKDNSIHGLHRNDDYPLDYNWMQRTASAHRTASGSTKRKYRRRPKPDEHAPERPPTAYVIFSSHVRRSLKSHVLTFAETAKVVGRRWQNLPAKVQGFYQQEANVRKEKYNTEMAQYEMSPEYSEYQKYLKEFKTKHTTSRKEDIHSKSKTQTSVLTRSSSYEYGNQSSDSIIGSDESNSLDSCATVHNQAKHSYPPKPVSRISHSSTVNSPRRTNPSSSVSASPWSAAVHQKEVPSFPSSNAPEFAGALLPAAQSLKSASSALNQIGQFSLPTHPPIESRSPSSFAALLRAGELARIAHEAIDNPF